MDIIEESVKKMEEIIRDTGCDDGAVVLRRCIGSIPCQYERGVCIESCYGGRTGEFVSGEPVEATTKISFMFGASINGPKMKGAACAILNVLASFLCLSRGVRSCPVSSHHPCLTGLGRKTAGKRIYCVGPVPVVESEFARFLTADPASADVILINNDGLLAENVTDIIRTFRGRKEILLIGPSASGIAALERLERFCPYGT